MFGFNSEQLCRRITGRERLNKVECAARLACPVRQEIVDQSDGTRARARALTRTTCVS